MTYRKLRALGFALLVLVPVAAAGQGFGGPGGAGEPAGGPGGPGGPHGPGGHQGLRHLFPPPGYLNLTDEQVDAVRTLRDEMRTEMEALGEEHRALREQLRTAIESDNPDATEIGELTLALHGFRERFRTALESFEGRFTALLTAEQRVKYEHFKELMRLHRGRGDRRGQGEKAMRRRARRWGGEGGYE